MDKVEEYETAARMVADNLCALNQDLKISGASYWIGPRERSQVEWEAVRSNPWYRSNFSGIDLLLADGGRMFQVRIRVDDYGSGRPRLGIDSFKPNLEEQTVAEIIGILVRQ